MAAIFFWQRSLVAVRSKGTFGKPLGRLAERACAEAAFSWELFVRELCLCGCDRGRQRAVGTSGEGCEPSVRERKTPDWGGDGQGGAA